MTDSSHSLKNCDAGLRHGEIYRVKLPKWRYTLRQYLLPVIRHETPFLSSIQKRLRSDALDSYFALSANLGTHTFFMTMLPIFFWFGYTEIARSLIRMLALGVFISGFLKDLLCLPRPLSPPLHRINMSGSAALEYGFPSTHSTNAVSVMLYVLLSVRKSENMSEMMTYCLSFIAVLYGITITFGRIYCGMHGFLDVLIGSTLGAVITAMTWYLDSAAATIINSDEYWILLVPLVVIILIRIHPEPADDCPCFDDGVAFASVLIGMEMGSWHYAKSPYSWQEPVLGTVPYSFAELGLLKVGLRVIFGVFVVFSWRATMKTILLHLLPPLYRFIEEIGLDLPRRYFIRATQYKVVPSHLPDETLPAFTQLPELIRNVRRTRSDSVGPQSAADVYETLALRERNLGEPNRKSSNLLKSNRMNEVDIETTPLRGEAVENGNNDGNEGEIFAKIQSPRVRYDVEVVTKIFVYSGIAWWTVEGIPILFELLGLGVLSSLTDK